MKQIRKKTIKPLLSDFNNDCANEHKQYQQQTQSLKQQQQ